MASDKLKMKYELHYWDTDITGQSEQDLESLVIKPIYFPVEGKWRDTPYRLAVGLEWTVSFDSADKGIGSDSDLLSPFVGIAFRASDKLTLIPLIQHFSEYSGDDIDIKAARLIGIWKLDAGYWTKLDAKLPYDWDEEEASGEIELQFCRIFNPGFGLYVDGLAGISDNRFYDWGLGIGVRFIY